MHRYTDETEALARAIVAYARDRIASPQPLDGSATARSSTRRAGETVTPEGLGWEEALRVWSRGARPGHDLDRPPRRRSRSSPARPRRPRVLFDLVVGASSTIAAGWIDGAGAIWAENQALRWLADLAGFPEAAGGVFVSGGSAGNLVGAGRGACRGGARLRRTAPRPVEVRRRPTPCTRRVAAAARVMDVDVLDVPGDERGRLTGDGARGSTLDATAGEARRVRGRGERRRDERRHGRRPRRGRGGLRRPRRSGSTSTAPTAAPGSRRRRVRDRFRGHRARRLVHRRPAQVAVRALRRLRAAVPRPRARATAPTGRWRPTSTP